MRALRIIAAEVYGALFFSDVLVVGINKPLSCLYQHGPQPVQLANYVLEILLFMEKNLLEPPYSSGVYLSLLPSMYCTFGNRGQDKPLSFMDSATSALQHHNNKLRQGVGVLSFLIICAMMEIQSLKMCRCFPQ
jgi:hypothetical protein